MEAEKYFTPDNTDGFTESQLDQLNAQLEKEMENNCYFPVDSWERESFKRHLAVKLLNKY